MKKRIFASIVFCMVVFMLAFGCSKKNPSGPASATNTPTMTAVPTSTAVSAPNLSGAVTVPANANGKHFAVIVDNDTNTANGYVAAFNGIVNSTSMPYAFLVTAGNYYVYAYVDMNSSGMTGPGGLDYFGNYNAWSVVVPTATGVNFNCTAQLDMTVTLNVTLPASAVGQMGFFGLFNGNTFDDLSSPVVGSPMAVPAGTQFVISLDVPPASAGTYYLLGFVDGNGNCGGGPGGCFPDTGDYLKVYGGTSTSWPASKNLSVNGDVTVDLSLVTITDNVSGTATLPGSANSNNYTIFASTVPMGPSMGSAMIITKTAQAGAGSTINYSLFVPVPGMYYLTLIVDMDASGWTNGGNGPASTGDYAGAYGVTPPILNWMSVLPPAPNASLPGTGFNFTCDTMPDVWAGPPLLPTPLPTPSSAGGTGTISGTISIPAGQTGKSLGVIVDMDLNPTNDNSVATFTVTLGSGSTQAYTITGVPAGASYYVYAATGSSGPPMIGDAVGVYGTTFPAFPASPNASVTSGGTLTANITLVAATANVSGRVYMPASAPFGSAWGVVIDTDTDGGNGGQLGMAVGAIGNSLNYFDYSMFLALPGDYYIYAIVDAAAPFDLFTNGPGCGDYFGFYNYPVAVHLTPGGSNTININANSGYMLCP